MDMFAIKNAVTVSLKRYAPRIWNIFWVRNLVIKTEQYGKMCNRLTTTQ
jgi:hypothetical protein